MATKTFKFMGGPYGDTEREVLLEVVRRDTWHPEGMTPPRVTEGSNGGIYRLEPHLNEEGELEQRYYWRAYKEKEDA